MALGMLQIWMLWIFICKIMLLRYFGSATVFFCHVGVWLTLFLRPKGEKVRYEKIFLPDVLFGGADVV